MNILYQFDNSYVPFAGVSMTSLFENNREMKFDVYILGENISSENMEILNELASKYHRKLIFVDTGYVVEQLELLGIPQYRGSHATNLKMFLPEIFKEETGRILYIDSDTAVVNSLYELEHFNLEGMPLAMAYDSLGKKHAKEIGLSACDGYYNAGVILFDLQRWKELDCTGKIIRHVKEVRAHYMAPDQDLINIVLKDQIKKLPMQYNIQPIHLKYQQKQFNRTFRPGKYYNDDEISRALEKPIILHFFRFAGEFPWNKDSQHPCVEVFDLYLSKSPWKDYEKQKPVQNGVVFKMERFFLRYMPDKIFLFMFKIAYDLFIKKCSIDSENGENNHLM